MYSPSAKVFSLFLIVALLVACDALLESPQNILSEVEAVELLEIQSAKPLLTAKINIDISEIPGLVDLSAKGKVLMRRGYLKTEPITYKESRPVFAEQFDMEQIKLAPPIMSTLLRYTEKEKPDLESLSEFNSIASVRLQIGRVKEVSVSSLKSISAKQYAVNYDLHIELNELGSMLYPAGLSIPWSAEFEYDTAGWSRQMGSARERDGLLKDEFSGFVSESFLVLRGLRAMYEAGVYPPDWKDFVEAVERDEEVSVLEDVAWAYHHNGESERAISIYENRIMPAVVHTQPIEEIVRLEEQLEQIRSSNKDVPAPVIN